MRKPDYNRRVAVTGLGVISSIGNDKDTAWNSLIRGVSGIGEITRFDVSGYAQKAGGEIRDFDAADWMDPKAARRSESSLHFGVAAAKQSLADSGFEITDENRTDVGVVFGSGAGGQQLMIDNYSVLRSKGPGRVQPTFIANALVDSCSGMIAIETGAIGHNICIVSACATGTHNVAEGAEAIRRGDCIAVLSGSTEAPLLEVAHAGFGNMRGLGNPRPGEGLESVSRPFDATRDGFVLGEGAAVLVVEEYEHARRRGARAYAEITGYANRCNAFHMTGLRPDGVELSRAVDVALDQARLDPGAVSYVNAHGSGTRQNDRHETAAIKRSLGAHAHEVPVSSIKSMVGHSLGAIGSIEVAACALAIEHGVVPPTANWENRDPECDLDYVPKTARDHRVDVALSVGSGFGGFQSAIVLVRPGGAR